MNTEELWDIPGNPQFADFLDPPSPAIRCSLARSACNVRAHVPTAHPLRMDRSHRGRDVQRQVGKLIRRVRRAVIARKQVQVFKSHLDARYAGLFSVSSHDGVTVEAEPVDSADEISRRLRDTTEVVAVDEAQFLDDGIVDLANRLADRGVRVILAGTDVDFRGLPFGPMPILMCVAEVVDKFQAICVVCGGPATGISGSSTAAGIVDSPTIMVGGRESYEADAVIAIEFPGKMKIKPRFSKGAWKPGVRIFDCSPGSWLPAPDSVLNVGLTGNIASGKSTVVELLKKWEPR